MVRQAHHERRSEDFEKAITYLTTQTIEPQSEQPSTEFPLQTVSVPSKREQLHARSRIDEMAGCVVI